MNNKEARKLMKAHGHRFGYCSNCGPMIICGYCGNNCCNAGSGDGCKDQCEEAYAIQDAVKYPWYYKLRFYFTKILPTILRIKILVPISNWFYNKGARK